MVDVSGKDSTERIAVAEGRVVMRTETLDIVLKKMQKHSSNFVAEQLIKVLGAEGKGLPGEPVREMLIEAVEQRFGAVEAIPDDHVLEFLSDNGGAYIAADTRSVARQLGLKPINTPVCSPQSNGMAESFVNRFKRDYVSRMDLTDAPTVMAQLPAAFEHFNEVHPHSSLKMRSPREFRRHQAAQARQLRQDGPALHCD